MRKASKTVLLHLGHLGLAPDSITYMRHRGHPTRTIDFTVGSCMMRLLGCPKLFAFALVAGDSSTVPRPPDGLGGERLRVSSSFGVPLAPPPLSIVSTDRPVLTFKNQKGTPETYRLLDEINPIS